MIINFKANSWYIRINHLIIQVPDHQSIHTSNTSNCLVDQNTLFLDAFISIKSLQVYKTLQVRTGLSYCYVLRYEYNNIIPNCDEWETGIDQQRSIRSISAHYLMSAEAVLSDYLGNAQESQHTGDNGWAVSWCTWKARV